MKNTLLLLATLVAAVTSMQAQDVNIPDANFKTYLLDNTAINTNGDTEIQVTEAEAFTGTIDCNSLGINTLEGIEAFTNLTVLHCYDNNLSTLDVGNNTALEVLYCSGNSLVSLDMTENVALTELYCHANNLTSLNLTQNEVLTNLYCYNNSNLNSLDVTQNEVLTFLFCGNNNLTTLDLSNNTALEQLIISDENLNSFDLSNNTALLNLNCVNMNLTSLDLSENLALVYLNCGGNNLTSIDVSNNTALESLRCNDNNLTSLDVTQNVALTELQCLNNANLTYLNVKNGNNTILDVMFAYDNPSLSCIQVDDVANSNPNWDYDPTASLSEDCPYSFDWIGGTNSDWNTASNWNISNVPDSNDNVQIPQVTTQYPEISGSVTVNSLSKATNAKLTIKSGASLITNGGSIGKITVERDLTANWHLIAPPLTTETQEEFISNNSDIATGTGSNIGLATYNTTDDSWDYATGGTGGFTTLHNGEGFSVLLNTPGTVSFFGNAPTGTPTIGLSTGGEDSFNLLGNPFTSYISIDDVIGNNYGVLKEHTLWFWDGEQGSEGAYVTVNLTEGGHIAPTQGFFVSAKDTGGSFEFDPILQSHDTGTFYRTANNGYTKLTLSVTNGSLESNSRIYLIDGMTTAFDNGYDGSMFMGIVPQLGVYTHSVANDVDKKLAIQALPDTGLEDMIIPVGVIAPEGEELSFSLTEINNLPTGVPVYLEDTQTNTLTELSDGQTYQASVNEGETELGRFFIHFSNATFNTETVESNGSQMLLLNGNELTISKTENNAKLSVYNLLGQAVYEQDLEASNKQVVKLNLSTGAYIAKLKGNGIEVNKKIVVSQ